MDKTIRCYIQGLVVATVLSCGPEEEKFYFILKENQQFCWRRKKVKVTQSCPAPCDPMDYRVHGILQARILKWIAIPFSRGSSQTRDQTQVPCTAGRFFTSWATREARGKWFLLRLRENVCECTLSHSVLSDSLQPHGLQPARSLSFLHWRVHSLPLSHLRSPREDI